MKGTALSYSNKGPITHPSSLTKPLRIKIAIIHDKKYRKCSEVIESKPVISERN
jgi:hypothetical protein